MKAFDKYPANRKSGAVMGISIHEENDFVFPVGHVRAYFEQEDGTREDLDLGHNFIVFEARLLMAQLMKFNFNAGDKIVNGVTHLAVGTGGPYQVNGQIKPFDPFKPPIPGVDIYNENRPGSFDKNGDGLSDLVNEVARNEVVANYVDARGAVSTCRTNIVDFTATFDLDEANEPLVEMAIFGGDEAAESGRGTMVAVKTFPVINKTRSARLTFTWRLAF